MLFKSKKNHQEQVYKNAYRAFFILCMRYCNSKEEAEEAFNDGMVKYFNYERKNKVKESTRYALIKKILRNTCIDRLRKKRLLFEEVDVGVVENYKSEHDEIAYQYLKEEMLGIIQNLPPTTRMVFNLYIFEGWSHQEIAKHLKISINTSTWHLHQGKKRVLNLFNSTETTKSGNHG